MDALIEFHSSGYSHNNIKPSNIILFEREKGVYECKLDDCRLMLAPSMADSQISSKNYLAQYMKLKNNNNKWVLPQLQEKLSQCTSISAQTALLKSNDIFAIGQILTNLIPYINSSRVLKISDG